MKSVNLKFCVFPVHEYDDENDEEDVDSDDEGDTFIVRMPMLVSRLNC